MIACRYAAKPFLEVLDCSALSKTVIAGLDRA